MPQKSSNPVLDELKEELLRIEKKRPASKEECRDLYFKFPPTFPKSRARVMRVINKNGWKISGAREERKQSAPV